MYTIKELCRVSGLSRSTLLYYDSVGLLKPSERSPANYRLYSEESLKGLEKICLYREAGVPVQEITKILNQQESGDTDQEILEKSLLLLNREARKIRGRQDLILDLLKGKGQKPGNTETARHELILETIKLTGLKETDIERLHAFLEKNNPQAHLDLLEALGFCSEEIERICSKAKTETN
jgi:DNA-binding transcriptional MerR regulator